MSKIWIVCGSVNLVSFVLCALAGRPFWAFISAAWVLVSIAMIKFGKKE